MSDQIPVGSPPAPPGRHAAPGGWYADPVDGSRERYWDGWQWTRNLRPRAGAAPAAPKGPTAPPVPGHGSAQPPMAAQPGPYGQPPQGYSPQGYPPQGFPPQGYAPPGYVAVPATADGVPLARWWWRVLAYVIDYFLLSAVVQIIAAVTGLAAQIDQASREYQAYLTEVLTTGATPDFAHAIGLLNTPASMIVSVISSVAFIIYSGLMLQARGATLGKMICRLRVVPLDQGRGGPALDKRRAWVRPLVTEAIAIIPLVGLIDLLFPLWDRRKQALHDKIAGTQVVREPKEQNWR